VVEDLIRDLANSLGSWAYLLVAVIACAETAAFLGFIAPGEFTIIIGGVLAGEGTLSIQLLIGIVWASIVLGDSIGFYIGRRAGRNLIVKHGPKVRLTEERLMQVEEYFKRHGGKTIFFGRWVGFVRPLMPFTAGTSGLPYRRFLPYDVLSAGLFGATFTLLGYIFWRNIDTVTKIVGRGAIGFGILVALVIGAIWAYRRLREPEERARLAAFFERQGRRPLLRPIAAVLTALWRLLLRPVVRLLTPPVRFAGQRLTPGELGIEFTTVVSIAAVAGYVFGAYTDVISSSPLLITPGDERSLDMSRDIQSGFLTDLAKVVTVLGRWQVAAGFLAVAIVLVGWMRRWYDAAVLASGFIASQVAVPIVKDAVDRPRPADPLTDVGSSASFPSGHAATAVAYVALAVVAARALSSNVNRSALMVIAIVLAALIGLSRAYLRLHYLSDVIGGWALGAFCFSFCAALALVISFLRHNKPPASEAKGWTPRQSPT
jgi:membrane protein DedA with SNARE-associated domain/membrane-associated phospholipid phosphatase